MVILEGLSYSEEIARVVLVSLEHIGLVLIQRGELR